MYSHLAEIVAEAGFHEGPRFGIQWLTRRAQHFVDDEWSGFGLNVTGSLPLQPFFAALGALAPGDGVLPAGTFALQGTCPCRN
jgi:hypothetical protein